LLKLLRFLRFRSCAAVLTWTLALLASSAIAQTALYKTNDTNDLGATTSWTLATGGAGGNPSSLDGTQIATFDNTISASNNAAFQTIITSVAFAGISVLDPAFGIQIGSEGGSLTLGSSGITTSASEGITINAPLVLSASQTWDMAAAGTISGALTGGAGIQITKTGSGTLTWLNASISGGSGITVAQGILLTAGATSTVPIVLDGGTYQLGSTHNNSPVSSSTTGTILAATARSFAGTLAGSGTVTVTANNPSGSFSWSADTSGFSGTMLVNGNSTTGLALFGATGSNLSTFTVDLEHVLSGGFPSVSIGALMGTSSGAFANLATVPLTVGALNTSTTFAGFIKSTNTFTKTGTGTLTLSNNGNIYTGATVINQGTLAVTGALTATSSTTINSGGTLAGTGTISSSGTVTLNSGGIVAPGATLTLKNLTWASGGTLLAATTDGVGSHLLSLGSGTLTKSGTGTYDVDFGGVTFSSPYTYTLITYGAESGYSSGDFTAVDATFGPNAIGAFTAGPTSLTYTISIVPEPSAFALLAGSLGLLIALRRRRA